MFLDLTCVDGLGYIFYISFCSPTPSLMLPIKSRAKWPSTKMGKYWGKLNNIRIVNHYWGWFIIGFTTVMEFVHEFQVLPKTDRQYILGECWL